MNVTAPLVSFATGISVLSPAMAQVEADSIAPGSRIQISSASEKSLNVVVEVDWDGEAETPLCGKVKIGRIKKNDALQSMRLCLSRYFKKAPDISMEEILPRQYAVRIGKRTEKPRVARAPAQSSVASLIAKEGIPAEEGLTVRLLSPFGLDIVAPATEKIWTKPFQWRGGETLVLEKSESSQANESFDVLGEVRKPGKYSYKPSQTVIDVLREVQGPTPQASFDSVFIYRHMNNQKIETTWDDKNHKIEPGDVLLVPSQKETTFDKSLRWTSSTLAIVNTIFLILLARR